MCTLQTSAAVSTLPATRALERMLAIEESSAPHSQQQQVEQDQMVANAKANMCFGTSTLFDAVTNSFMKQQHDELHEFPIIEWTNEEEDGKLLALGRKLLKPRNFKPRHRNKPSLSRSIAFACDLERLSEEPFST